MSNHNKHTLVPRLRFPEFQNAGEWEVKLLGEVIEKNKEKNKEGKYTLVQSVSNKFGFIKQDEFFEKRIVASKDTSNYYVIRKGCFAYNPSRIDVGSLAYKYDDNVSIISPLYISFRANHQKINDLFLLHWLKSERFNKQMILEGGVRNTLNYDNLIEILIPVPSLPEQQKIAACLSSLDDLITAESQKLEWYLQHKKGLLQNLFPQSRLNRDSSDSYDEHDSKNQGNQVNQKNHSPDNVPKLRFPEFVNSGAWEVKRLGEVADLIKEKTKGRKFKLLSISAGQGLISQVEKFGKEIAGNSYPNYLVIRKYDFAYNKSSTKLYPEGEIAMLEDNEECAVPNSIFTCFRFKQKEIYPKYAKYLFIKNHHGSFLRNLIAVGARAHGALQINNEDLFLIPIPFPSLPEQQKIAACLSSLDDLINAQRQKIELLQQHKKGLLQGLFPDLITN